MHIVVLPFSSQGHLNPCLMLARLLTSQGFTFTFVITEELASKLEEGEREVGLFMAPNIRHATIRYEAAFQPDSRTPSDFLKTFQMGDSLRPGFEDLLRKLMLSPPGVSCIIIDCFASWGWQVASKFSIPALAFYTTNSHALMVMLHAGSLISNGSTDLDKIIEDIRGLVPLQVGDLPQSIHILPSFAMNLREDLQKAAGVILNTVLELEEEPLKFIRSKLPFYAIGPLPLMLGLEASLRGCNVGLSTEERKCLDWLDTRPDASVLFVAFGSRVNIDDNQMRNLAEGLEASGQAFLWVIRSSAALLPKDYKERTKERGFLNSWAPQLKVLSHPAVGGFITHCGWNSITENLSLRAVPMICWPQRAEQRLNRRLLVDKWKVGLALQEDDGVVKKAELEKAVIDVMQGEVGRELWKRALEFKQTLLAAVQEGGSSHYHLKALEEDIRRLQSGVHFK